MKTVARVVFSFALGSMAPAAAPAAVSPRPGWFLFSPTNTAAAGEIGLADWLDRPAGRHGFATARGDEIVFEDGTPVKFWGTNHGNLTVAPDAAEADRRAAWYAKFGLNAVRLHKFLWPGDGIGSHDRSTEFVPALLDRMDYYVTALQRAGIYCTWSHLFGHRPQPGDRSRLLAYDEVRAAGGPSFLAGSTYGIVNLFEDLQDLNIEVTVNLLEHLNPHTGRRYADDPGLAMIELQNEDNAWWTAADQLKTMPTYRAKLAALFCDWLRQKYGTEEKLVAAWGPRGLDLWPEWQTGERLDRDNIFPVPNRRYYQPEVLARSPAPQRLLDAARFLHERQDAFYQRFAAAIRATGYRGLLTGSCWKADDGLPHYYNLLADARVGVIDRHNYFGGNGHVLHDGMATGGRESLLARPDLGLLAIGFTQVHRRPFSFSEWTVLPPNPWVAAGPPVVAFYGLGLQGWDMSFHFASSSAGFSDALEAPNVYNTNSPTQVGTFPLLARAIYRGDVRPGWPVLPRRRLGLANLERGELGFTERAFTEGDANRIASTVPAEALSIGRVELEFADRFVPAPMPAPDLAPWASGTEIRANTGELTRDVAHGGFFTVNTAATKGLVGFARDRRFVLGEIAVTSGSEFAVALLTSRERDRDLTNCRSALLVVLARAENTGQRFNAEGTVLEQVGGPPLWLEGVRLQVEWPRLSGATVHVLDHDGLRTERTVSIGDHALQIDSARDRALYYEVAWE